MRTAVCLLACLLLAGLGAAAAAEDDTPIMPLAQVQRGMKGYGVTSLGKDQPERFDVEVVGVMRGWAPKGDIVMVKLSGAVMELTNGFEGMSGSPVYIDGKLLGAVAYGWPFSKTPLAGVTPIEEMLKVRSLDGQAAAGRYRRRQGPQPPGVPARAWPSVAKMLLPGKDGPPDPAAVRQALTRAGVPLLFSDAARRAVPLDVGGMAGAALPPGRGRDDAAAAHPPDGRRRLWRTPAPWPRLSESGFVPVQARPAAGRLAAPGGQPQPAAPPAPHRPP